MTTPSVSASLTGEVQDQAPPEVELAKAVDYLEANCHRIRDWSLLSQTIDRVSKFSPSVQFQKLASKPRIVA